MVQFAVCASLVLRFECAQTCTVARRSSGRLIIHDPCSSVSPCGNVSKNTAVLCQGKGPTASCRTSSCWAWKMCIVHWWYTVHCVVLALVRAIVRHRHANVLVWARMFCFATVQPGCSERIRLFLLIAFRPAVERLGRMTHSVDSVRRRAGCNRFTALGNGALMCY